jgi:hypothetical protein
LGTSEPDQTIGSTLARSSRISQSRFIKVKSFVVIAIASFPGHGTKMMAFFLSAIQKKKCAAGEFVGSWR